MSFVLFQPPLKAVDVLLSLRAGGLQAGQLGLALGDGVLEGPPASLVGFGQDGLSLLLGAGQVAGGLLAGLRDSEVCGALSQDQRLAERVIGSPGLGSRRLGPLSPLHRLAQPVLQDLDTRGDLFEELIDVLRVIAPHLLAKLDLTQRLRGDLHGPQC